MVMGLLYFKRWRLAVGGWWLVAVGGGWRRLAAVGGGGRRLLVSGWWLKRVCGRSYKETIVVVGAGRGGYRRANRVRFRPAHSERIRNS